MVRTTVFPESSYITVRFSSIFINRPKWIYERYSAGIGGAIEGSTVILTGGFLCSFCCSQFKYYLNVFTYTSTWSWIVLLYFIQIHCNYLLTYSMVQSPSWEANWSAASQEILRISRNPKVHYRTHKRTPPVSIPGQPNLVPILTSHFLEFHPNIIRTSMPRSPQWSPSFRFTHQHPVHPPLLTNTCHMPSPSHSSRFYHPHNIGWGVQVI